ncbi:MAG: hypothetical protein HY465_02135, partial [Deltaproteobacteria bacterium]|nr:hypothetical protein [Deltaproteobacteria bacterium]
YDAANLLLDAIVRAQSLNSTSVRDAIAATKNFPGIVGSISLDEHRNARKPIVIVQIQSGKFVFKEAISDQTPIAKGEKTP